MTPSAVTIVDYGVGNTGSLRNALARVGFSADISHDPDEVRSARRILLPGVGSFDFAVERLTTTGLGDAVVDAAAAGTPLAGVCLGMQLLMDGSDEGVRPGLGIIPGRARILSARHPDERLLVPHMGWAQVTLAHPSRALTSLSTHDRFYFVHSYAVDAAHDADVLAWTDYGRRFASIVERGNVIGMQFHPEKSHRFGLALLADFARSEP